MRIILLSVILSVILSVSLAGSYEYLDFSGNVETFILQNSGVSIIKGPCSGLVNPAGLAGYKNKWINGSHLNWLFDFKLEYLEIGSVYNNITFAGYIDYFAGESFNIINSAGEKGAMLNYYDLVGGIASGMKIGKISAGINIKKMNTQIQDYSGSGFSLDIGMQYPYLDNKLNFGICTKNIMAVQARLDRKGKPMKLQVLAGVGYQLSKLIEILSGMSSAGQYHISSIIHLEKAIEIYTGYGFGLLNTWGVGMKYSFINPGSHTSIEIGVLNPITGHDEVDIPLRIGLVYELEIGGLTPN